LLGAKELTRAREEAQGIELLGNLGVAEGLFLEQQDMRLYLRATTG
jgi:hypothetical protein